MPILKLSAELVDGLECPLEKAKIEYCDSEVKGLYVLVSKNSDVKTFFHRYKDSNGKTCHLKLGRTTDLGLAQARAQVLVLKGKIAKGDMPQTLKEKSRGDMTFSTYFDLHYIPHVKARKRTWKGDLRIFNLRIRDKFGSKRLKEINRQDVQAFHTKIKDQGLAAATCDHHLKLIRRTLNLAVEWELLETNPVARVQLYNEDNKVEHYLDDQQLQVLLNVLRTDANRNVCAIALYLLSTGARLNEALQAKWVDIDEANKVWRIPAAISKSKRIRSIPLNDVALEVLKEVRGNRAYEYVFTNQKTGRRYSNIHKVWERLRLEAKLPKLRLHDLRHQYASFLVNSGRTLYEVQHILGHSDPTVTQRYAHLSTKSLQEAADSAAVAMRRPANPAQNDVV